MQFQISIEPIEKHGDVVHYNLIINGVINTCVGTTTSFIEAVGWKVGITNALNAAYYEGIKNGINKGKDVHY